MFNKLTISIAVIITLIVCISFLYHKDQPCNELVVYEDCSVYEDVLPQQSRYYLYGIPADSFTILKSKIKRNQVISDLLVEHGVEYKDILNVSQNYRHVFDVRHFRSGNPYTLFMNDLSTASYFIYEINNVDFVVYDFDNDTVYTGQKETYVEKKAASGVIESSLYVTLQQNGINPMLTMELEDVFGWVIDFYRLQKGDHFKVIYSEKFVEGKSAGIDKIIATVFSHYDNDYYAFYFQPDGVEVGNYFDESGGSLRKAFLKSPLKYSRITSKYSKKRFHPVLKQYKAHLGVDYAAPTGTPIRAVGDGVVEEARYKKNNGNYVKIKHNSKYSTQYLHMSKFASGIKPGAKVVQGQTIGYVGSTGLATGPHVCFRFWKNGVQVDPLSVQIPPSEPIEEQYLSEYVKLISGLNDELAEIDYKKTVLLSSTPTD